MKENERNQKSRMHNESVSREKKEYASKERQVKKSIGKPGRESSTPKQIDLNLINKNNIKIKMNIGFDGKEK